MVLAQMTGVVLIFPVWSTVEGQGMASVVTVLGGVSLEAAPGTDAVEG